MARKDAVYEVSLLAKHCTSMIKGNDVLIFFDFKKSQFIPYTRCYPSPIPGRPD
jgi:hypothetical protein